MVVSVGVVTDSTAYLPAGVAEEHGIRVVPLHVVMGGRSGLEGVEVSPAEVASALRERRVKVSTSRPTPDQFVRAYRECGTPAVVSIHVSVELSGTLEAAQLAAREVAADGITVRLVDSGSVAMGLGFPVLSAASAAATGADVDAVDAVAVAAALATTTYVYVETMEHLRRGGRVTARSALVGTALAVKPLLLLRRGRIELQEKVRTASRALERLEELAIVAAGDGPVDVAVHHLDAPERAHALQVSLVARLPGLRSSYVSQVGAVVGAHLGPGLLGVVLHRT